MKKFTYLILLFTLYGCPFTWDPARGLFNVYNNTDEAIYVFFQCGNVDTLPSLPKLELFHFFDNKSFTDASGNPVPSSFGSPEYRINAYTFGSITIWGSREKPRLPNEEKEVTLFFITERTMRDHEWEEIHKGQMYVKKVTLTKEEIENSDWKYTYYP